MSRILLAVPAFCILAVCALPPLAAAEKWQGVDEAVIERIAREHGREPKPLVDTDRGDLLLFLFLGAGSIAGFAAGYAWRMLSENREKKDA